MGAVAPNTVEERQEVVKLSIAFSGDLENISYGHEGEEKLTHRRARLVQRSAALANSSIGLSDAIVVERKPRTKFLEHLKQQGSVKSGAGIGI